MILKKYTIIRRKYYKDVDGDISDPIKNRNGLFLTMGSINADPVAKAFYSSNTLTESFTKLRSIVNEKEHRFLLNFYKNFEKRYSRLTKESKIGFKGSIYKTAKPLKNTKVISYFNKISHFYNVKGKLHYRALYVWWPPLNRTNATPTGLFLVLRQNPTKHQNLNYSDVVAHEINHSISAHQPIDQKKKLTNTFLKICPIESKLKRYRILEEPLAVNFGQLIYNKKFLPSKFSTSENLYRNAWINTYSRIIFTPLLKRFESEERITDGFIEEAATLCKDILDASVKIGK